MNSKDLDQIIEILELQKNNTLVKIEASDEKKEQTRLANLESDNKRYLELKDKLAALGFDIEGKSTFDILSELAEEWNEVGE